MSKIGWFGVVRSYPRSLNIVPFDRVKIAPFDGAHMSSY